MGRPRRSASARLIISTAAAQSVFCAGGRGVGRGWGGRAAARDWRRSCARQRRQPATPRAVRVGAFMLLANSAAPHRAAVAGGHGAPLLEVGLELKQQWGGGKVQRPGFERSSKQRGLAGRRRRHQARHVQEAAAACRASFALQAMRTAWPQWSPLHTAALALARDSRVESGRMESSADTTTGVASPGTGRERIQASVGTPGWCLSAGGQRSAAAAAACWALPQAGNSGPGWPARCRCKGQRPPSPFFCTVATGTISWSNLPDSCDGQGREVVRAAPLGGGSEESGAGGWQGGCPASIATFPIPRLPAALNPYASSMHGQGPTRAAAALACEAAAYRSCSSRSTPNLSATFSAVKPAVEHRRVSTVPCKPGQSWDPADQGSAGRPWDPQWGCLARPGCSAPALVQAGQAHVLRVLAALDARVVAALPVQRVCGAGRGRGNQSLDRLVASWRLQLPPQIDYSMPGPLEGALLFADQRALGEELDSTRDANVDETGPDGGRHVGDALQPRAALPAAEQRGSAAVGPVGQRGRQQGRAWRPKAVWQLCVRPSGQGQRGCKRAGAECEPRWGRAGGLAQVRSGASGGGNRPCDRSGAVHGMPDSMPLISAPCPPVDCVGRHLHWEASQDGGGAQLQGGSGSGARRWFRAVAGREQHAPGPPPRSAPRLGAAQGKQTDHTSCAAAAAATLPHLAGALGG